MANKSVAVARTKAKSVQRGVEAAEAKLHVSNAVLGDTGNSKVLSTDAARSVIAQNVDVEEQLHEAVQELEVVGELLKVAEATNAAHDDNTVAGRRSGAGMDSLLAHMNASASKRARSDMDRHAPAASKAIPEEADATHRRAPSDAS
jgi:hypothetical protein